MRPAIRLLGFLAIIAVSGLAYACKSGDKQSGAKNGPAAAHDTLSDVTVNEDGFGQIQIGMSLDDAVNMGLLNRNPNMNSQCDYVYPAVGAGVPENVGVMVVKGKIVRIDVDTGAVTTDDGAKIGDSEDRIKNIYGDDVKVTAHKYNPGWHYMTVMGDSTSAGRAIVFETDGKKVTRYRAGELPEVQWVEGCG
jgi:hypothetical protein